MKLSEILKDWPEKKQWFYPELAGPDEFEKRLGQAKIDSANDMLTSCDREIDRESLAKELFITFGTDVKEWEHSVQRKLYFDFAEIIILSMPTWLKRIKEEL